MAAGTTVVMVAVGGSAALAQPASTTPTPPPAPVTTTAPVTSDAVPAPALSEDTADPCAVPTTTAPPTSTTAPPVTTTTTAVPAPLCDPTTTPVAPEPIGPETAAASESAPAPEQPPVAPAQDTVAPPTETVAPLPAEFMPAAPAADQPIAPDDPELTSKTAEPDLDWRPTDNPKSTIVPGQMRSDREEIPAPFTKEDADNAEIGEARLRSSRNLLASGRQYYWPAPFQVCDDIRDKYNSLGGPASFLSYPTSGNIINPGGTGQRVTFLNGPIYWSAATGAHPVVNSFLNRWGIHSYEAGWLKYPTTDEIVLPDGGRRQEFQTGAIYVAFQNAAGSAIRNGPIRDKWNTVGGTAPGGSFLGYLTGDEIGLPDGQGRMARFERGVIYWAPTTGAFPVTGDVLEIWAEEGYEESGFGYPTGDQTTAGFGFTQPFQGGSIDVMSFTHVVDIGSGGPCVFQSRTDYVHMKKKPPIPRKAGAHVWYNPVSNCPPNIRAVVTAQLQILNPQGFWQNRGTQVVNTDAKPGSGAGNWTSVGDLCQGEGPLTWRVVGDVDLIGALDGDYKPISFGKELPCQ
ncbi:LGFP repeat-containing protein [Rhodococcus zopfii]